MAIKGLVTKSTGSWYMVRLENGSYISARTRGKLRLKGSKSTNPVAVGDHVTLQEEPGQDTSVITEIQPRHNYIIRKSNKLSSQTQVLAANLDQAVMVATLVLPQTSTGFIDRFLVTAEAYHIPAIILFNKLDIYEGEALEVLDELMDLYRTIGYQCLPVSAKTGEGVDQVKTLLKDKVTLISGHSGVGKSTLINRIDPNIQQKEGDLSGYHLKGKHTTTFAEMFELEQGGYIIDTPGIRDFGVVNLEEAEISHYFPEMRPLLSQCRFNNCKHLNEPNCAVIAAAEAETIAPERYASYLSILRNEDMMA